MRRVLAHRGLHQIIGLGSLVILVFAVIGPAVFWLTFIALAVAYLVTRLLWVWATEGRELPGEAD